MKVVGCISRGWLDYLSNVMLCTFFFNILCRIRYGSSLEILVTWTSYFFFSTQQEKKNRRKIIVILREQKDIIFEWIIYPLWLWCQTLFRLFMVDRELHKWFDLFIRLVYWASYLSIMDLFTCSLAAIVTHSHVVWMNLLVFKRFRLWMYDSSKEL